MSPQELSRLEYLRGLMALMREVGAVQADGIILGPPPTKLEQLEHREAKGELVDKEALAEERRRQRIEAARQEIRDKVGADLSDEQCDRLMKPEAA